MDAKSPGVTSLLKMYNGSEILIIVIGECDGGAEDKGTYGTLKERVWGLCSPVRISFSANTASELPSSSSSY